MALYERGYHPLNALEEEGAPKIDIALGLPAYVNTEKIGVNIRTLHRMMRVGGLSTLSVVGTAGETSSYTPNIDARNSDGTASASKAGIEKIVPTYAVHRELQETMITPPYITGRWADATVAVNLDEIQDRIGKKKELIRSPEAWGKHLDSALRDGVAKAGVEHVILDSTNLDKLKFSMNTTMGYTYPDLNFGFAADIANPVEGFVANSLWFHALTNVLDRMHYQTIKHVTDDTEGFRWSLFSGPQFDRAALLKSMAQMNKVVKALPQE